MDNTYSYETTSTIDPAVGGAFLFIYFAFLIAGYVYMALSLSTIAKKLDVDGAWMAWVPVANIYLMVKCAGLPGWQFLLFFVPLVNFFFMLYVWYKLIERRGFEGWLVVLMFVPIANIVLPGYIAWGEPKGGSPAPEAAPVAPEPAAAPETPSQEA